MSYVIGLSDLLFEFSPERVFPFVEHNHGDITGYGHQDKTTFAEAVNRYDRACVSFSEGWTADDVEHACALGDDVEDALALCAEGTPGASPVTILWGRR